MKKVTDHTWDFRGADTKELTHCFHRYPAQMIPQIARRLITAFGGEGRKLFDPYCGSGTSLVEGLAAGMQVAGCDINPLAVIITRAKTADFDPVRFERLVNKFDFMLSPLNIQSVEKNTECTTPTITNLDFWFPRKSQKCLGILRTLIDSERSARERDFLVVAFAETVRESSFTRSGEFKLFRIPKHRMDCFDPNVYAIFLKKLKRNLLGYKEFAKVRSGEGCNVYLADTTRAIPAKVGKFDLVVTSPPYGDSRTTVAYGQFTTLPLEWLGYDKARQIDSIAMGGKVSKSDALENSPSLKRVLKAIGSQDEKRAKEVLAFYVHLDQSMEHVVKGLSRSGVICYVVGNRTVKSIQIPMDEIISEMFEQKGLKHQETIVRSIPNKAMPLRNSPTNKQGVLEKTMTEEYIVIMKKP